jgi:meso-butanediol dehydrogenase / (S,S)-butanediol dehydrogenase / diacetyl reductase
MGILEGRTALITGAGQGVGRGIALAYAAEGARVVVAGRTVSKCEAVVAEIVAGGGEAIAVACDVKVAADVEACVAATVATYGGVDILVNNAQEVPRGPILEVSDEAATAGWESGPLATLRFMRSCHPYLKAAEDKAGGVIVNLGSRAGVKPDPIHTGVYGGVKEAIRGISRAAAWEFAPDGIRVYVVLPLAASPALERLAVDEPAAYQRALASIPMGRFGDCETDIGRVCVFLAGPDAGYLTGITIPVDGGAAHLG